MIIIIHINDNIQSTNIQIKLFKFINDIVFPENMLKWL